MFGVDVCCLLAFVGYCSLVSGCQLIAGGCLLCLYWLLVVVCLLLVLGTWLCVVLVFDVGCW